MSPPHLTQNAIEHDIATAIRHHQTGHYKEAASGYRKALAIDPENIDALHLLGVLAHQTGDNDTARLFIEKALHLDSTNPNIFNNLGEVYRAQNRLKNAVHCYCQAIKLKADYFEAHNNLGNVLFQLGLREEAVESYRQAILLNPNYAEAHNNSGIALTALGSFNEAALEFQKALSIDPRYAEAHNNFGNLLLTLGKEDEAEQAYRQAIAIKPDYAVPYNNLGKIFLDRGQLKEGMEACHKAIALDPAYDEAYYNLGTTFQEQGNLAAAEHFFNKALATNPDYASCKWNLSLLMLLQGRYEEGFRLYESRFTGGDSTVFANMNKLLEQLQGQTRWKGESLKNKTLLVIAEQGLGDNLMMMRYFPLLKKQGLNQLIIFCEPPLLRLFEHQTDVDAVFSMSRPLPFGRFDLYCPSMSLPYLFQTTLESIPGQEPYVCIPDHLKQQWRTRFANVHAIRVGLAWAGKGSYTKNQFRSIPLHEFGPLLNIPGIQFVNLQKGAEADQLKVLGWGFIDWMHECHDLLNSAALIDQLDLVISVDTSVAHLAGALGKQVWLLNRFDGDWRWLIGRNDSPWYPSMRIFRQDQQGCWTNVIHQLADALSCYQKAAKTGCSAPCVINDPQTWFEQGVALIASEDFAAAEQCLRAALRLAPHSLETLLNLGYVLGEQGCYEESLQCYNSVLDLAPDCDEARYNRAIHLLRSGDYVNGFNDYEARFAALKNVDVRNYSQPVWDGSPLNGRTILVYCEQGLGDTIMFARYIPVLAKLGGRVTLEVQQPLVSLLESLPGIEIVVEKTSHPPKTDLYCRLLSLPHLLQSTIESLPCQIPYLTVSPQRIAPWQNRLKITDHDYRIGLVWACKGRPLPNRTCPPEFLAPLLSLPTTHFFSLQVGEKDHFPLPENLSSLVTDATEYFKDFSDTAAFIMNLDLVITVDAAVAHLAGALGKPVWVMLPRLSEWRWLLGRSDSPWYPTMRLFRQPVEGDWRSVISDMVQALQKQLPLPQSSQAASSLFEKRTETKECHKITIDQAHLPATKQPPCLEQMDIQTCYDLGVQLKDSGNLTGAEACFRHIVKQNPELPESQHALGLVLQLQGNFKEAIAHYRAAIALDPHYANSHYNLAEILSKSGMYPEAVSSVRAAIHADPSHADAHWLYGMLLLLLGDFHSGWQEYEWRWKSVNFPSRIPELGRPLWDGSPLAGRTLLIHMEQGRGDMIQFVRYAALIAGTGGQVIVCAVRELVSILATVEGVTRSVDRDKPLPDFDVHIPVLSLPYLMKTTLETIPVTIPYLKPDPEKERAWQKILASKNRFRIGVAWQGASTHKNNQCRSCTLDEFEPLFCIGGIDFFSLQLGAGAKQRSLNTESLPLIDYTKNIHDFSDTAALLSQLDLIISVDTAVAHLAGALGKPVWVLLPFVPEWRWMLSRLDSPWYPTMKIFRQTNRGNWSEVITVVCQELEKICGENDVAMRRGIELLQQDKAYEAEQVISAEILKTPDNPEALCHLGAAQDAQGKYEQALDSYRAAIDLNPEYMQAFFNMGNTCKALGKQIAAISCYEQALKLAPHFVPTLLCLGNAYNEQGSYARAQEYFTTAISYDSHNAYAYQGLGDSLRGQEDYVNAAAAYQKVLDIDPTRITMYNMAGLAYHHAGKYSEAESCFRKALELSPHDTTLLNNLGTVLHSQERIDEEILLYRQLIEIDPSCVDGHWNLALALLTKGEYVEGWQNYEQRLNLKRPEQIQDIHLSRWDGSPLDGKTILLSCEQGFGDTIQFVRYVPLVVQRGGKVVIECQSTALKRLLMSLSDVKVVVAGDPLPHVDCYLPLLSLPLIFQTTLTSIPVGVPYLGPVQSDVETWRIRLGTSKSFRVGFAWSGRQNLVLNRMRTCPLEEFAPLLSLPNVVFHSLQIGEGSEQLAACSFTKNVFDYTGHILDFADTAAYIKNLDLVISIDSAVAHLAGSLGIPTWTLLPFGADWRWQLQRQDSPWYPTMLLFRQSVAGDWPAVILAVKNELLTVVRLKEQNNDETVKVKST